MIFHALNSKISIIYIVKSNIILVIKLDEQQPILDDMKEKIYHVKLYDRGVVQPTGVGGKWSLLHTYWSGRKVAPTAHLLAWEVSAHKGEGGAHYTHLLAWEVSAHEGEGGAHYTPTGVGGK